MAVPFRTTGRSVLESVTLIGENGQLVQVFTPLEGEEVVIPNTAFMGSDNSVRASVAEAFRSLAEGTLSFTGNFGSREGRAARRASPTFPA